jgi:hypothetical protein
MALSQSVASELLEAFRAGEGVDLVRESVRLVMQELIETEATEVVGAGRYERSETRSTQRNGSRPRLGRHPGRVVDQAELHGLLAKIRDLGVTLISDTVVDPAEGAP